MIAWAWFLLPTNDYKVCLNPTPFFKQARSLLIRGLIFSFFRITWIAYVAEFWVYPFLRAMPNNGRVVFFTLSFCVIVFFYFLGKWKTMFIWGGRLKRHTK